MGRTSEAKERKKHIDMLMLFPEDARKMSFFSVSDRKATGSVYVYR